MKKRLLPLLLLALTPGCAYLCSNTCEHALDANGKPVVRETHARIYTLFDANSTLAKMKNSPTVTASNQWSAGTYIGGLNESSSSTNLVAALQVMSQILGSLAQGAAAGIK
jgi:hypothetical protein